MQSFTLHASAPLAVSPSRVSSKPSLVPVSQTRNVVAPFSQAAHEPNPLHHRQALQVQTAAAAGKGFGAPKPVKRQAPQQVPNLEVCACDSGKAYK